MTLAVFSFFPRSEVLSNLKNSFNAHVLALPTISPDLTADLYDRVLLQTFLPGTKTIKQIDANITVATNTISDEKVALPNNSTEIWKKSIGEISCKVRRCKS